MDYSTLDELEKLKNKIHENVSVNDTVVCSLCDALIFAASKEKSWQDVTFGHVWRADYFFYVASDLKSFAKELDLAQGYIDETTPSILLEKYYTLKHVLYENTYDVQSAFRYTLKALDVAEKLGMSYRVGVNYGNIGAYYMDICYYEEAMRYTRKALETLCTLSDAKPRSIRLLLANMVQISLRLNDCDLARQSLKELSELPLDKKDLKIYIDYGYMRYYANLLDLDNCLIYLKAMFDDGLLVSPRAYVFEFLSEAFDAILCLEQKEKSHELLVLLREIVQNDEPDAKMSLCKLSVEWAKRFGSSEELSLCYREYYISFMAAQKNANKLKAEGLHAKVELNELYVKNDQSHKELSELTVLANCDDMTNVYNRRYLNILQDEILNCQKPQSVGFALIDIDYFKEYNDHYGHPYGDRLLRMVANCLKENTTQQMAVFRYGGDEFVCLYWEAKPKELEAYVKRVQATMKNANVEHMDSRCANRVTLSIGYGCRPVTGKTDLLTLFEDVDSALYVAKNEGRNRVRSIGDVHVTKGGA